MSQQNNWLKRLKNNYLVSPLEYGSIGFALLDASWKAGKEKMFEMYLIESKTEKQDLEWCKILINIPFSSSRLCDSSFFQNST